MRIAILSDIHGNPIALDAVLADAELLGVEAYWILGDLVAIGHSPVEVLERLCGLDKAVFVRGNTDRYVVTGEGPRPTREEAKADPKHVDRVVDVAASFAWTRGFVSGYGWYDWLARLPLEERLNLPDGTSALLVHAAPGTDDGMGLHPGLSNNEMGQLVNDSGVALVCVGHTHEIMDRRLPNARIVNPGSVSNPKAPDLRASYAILDATERGIDVHHRFVQYDHSAVIDAVRESHHPAADFIVSFQRGLHSSTPPHPDHVACTG